MPRPQKTPIRQLTAKEQDELERVARSHSECADRVARAKILLVVAAGGRFTDAARAAGRKSGQAVANLVGRFNRDGIAALDRLPGGHPPVEYGSAEKARILQEFKRAPDREQDGTATWSLTMLQNALRSAPDGLPKVSRQTVWQTLHEAGITWQQSRTWCETGTVLRKRQEGVVKVTDPQAAEKRA